MPMAERAERSGRAVRKGILGAVAPVALSLAVAAAACSAGGDDAVGGADADRAPVVATTSIMADLASAVTCGELRVPSLVPRDVDAHGYEPTVRDSDRLLSADMVVAVGLGLEERLEDSLDLAADEGVRVLRVGRRMEPVEVDGEIDPHVWMDPVRMALAAEVVGAELEEVEGLGVDTEDLRRCTREHAARLRALTGAVGAILDPVPPSERVLVTNHEALGYFADRFGLRVVGAVIPSTSALGEANPRDLDRLAETMRAEGVTTLFVSTGESSEVARALAARVGGGVEVVELRTESLGPSGGRSGSYVDMLTTDARLVAEALGGRG